MTERVTSSVKPGASPAEANAARRAATANIEKESTEKTGLRSADQLLRQLGQRGCAAAAGVEQRAAEHALRRLHLAPGVPVRQAQRAGGLRQRAGFVHGRQQGQQGGGVERGRRRVGRARVVAVRASGAPRAAQFPVR